MNRNIIGETSARLANKAADLRASKIPRRGAVGGIAALALATMSGCGETVVDKPVKVPNNAQYLGSNPGYSGEYGRMELSSLSFEVHTEDAPFVFCGEYHYVDYDGHNYTDKKITALRSGIVQITCTGEDLQKFPITHFASHNTNPDNHSVTQP